MEQSINLPCQSCSPSVPLEVPRHSPRASLLQDEVTEGKVSDNINNPVALSALAQQPTTPPTGPASDYVVPSTLTRRLYLAHFLSTWNNRSFEFGAVLFLASIFPHTLLALSIYALIRSGSAVVLGPVIGRTIDRKGRLFVMRFSIVAGRLAVVLSCIGFWVLEAHGRLIAAAKWGIFGVVSLLACVEYPCSVLNLVAVERDWVVVIAGANEACLRTLNARMRRIDLFCKLVGPLFIALIDGASTKVAIFVTLALNAASVPIEYLAILQVYNAEIGLHAPKEQPLPDSTLAGLRSHRSLIAYCLTSTFATLFSILKFYYKHRVFLPSFALALLYLTVLSFSGQMVTYLISAGFSSFHIGLVRTLSTIFELSATWIAPRVMKRIGPARAGMWFLSWQMLWLGVTVAFFWTDGAVGKDARVRTASGLAAGTILSRVGLWGYDLCAQLIIQEEVQGTQRGSFSSTEASLQNVFEMLSYISTIVWSRPQQFRYPILLSAVAVYAAGFLYGRFLRGRRGHLLHRPQCVCRKRHIDEMQPA